jgi:SAM-dependent methyltransferase
MVAGQSANSPVFTTHNIRLDDGTLTKPGLTQSMETTPWFLSARGMLDTVFPGDKSHLRIADLGCLEGGYAVEFARMGFQVLGIEVRESNIAACNYVKSQTDLPNLEFVRDNALNIATYGKFDAIFCCGLLYHLDRPLQFLETLSSVTKKMLILQTHFSLIKRSERIFRLPTTARWITDRIRRKPKPTEFHLSAPSENEGLPGKWFMEFITNKSFANREAAKLASWDNRRSFWIQREHLLQTIQDVGFDLVLEEYANLKPNIAESLLGGAYEAFLRGTFIGIKTDKQMDAAESRPGVT